MAAPQNWVTGVAAKLVAAALDGSVV